MSVGLLISILIRLLAFFWSLLVLHRIRDWRMGFLSVMLAFMALRQMLTLKSKFTSMSLSFSSLNTEWPGLIVSLMAFLAVFYLGRILTERKQTAARQEKLIAELEGQNAELERFTYTISHDLKTPLVTIKGFIGFLRKGLSEGQTRDMERDLDKIDKAAEKMAQSLDELLELSRVGRVVNPFEKVSLCDLAAEAVERLEAQIARVDARLHIAPDLPDVFVDRSRMLEVLVILIDNAIKYSSARSDAVVEIGCLSSASEVVFYVRDNGIGIESRYHDYVFGLFDRLDAETEGSGIGLTLAKRIIELHRGRIWVESEGAGKGTTVLFALPSEEDLPGLNWQS